MTQAEALAVADMGDNALWRWIADHQVVSVGGTLRYCDAPAHAREVALDVLAGRVRELEACPLAAHFNACVFELRPTDSIDPTLPGLSLIAYTILPTENIVALRAELAALKGRTCSNCRERRHLLCDRLAVSCSWIEFCGLWSSR